MVKEEKKELTAEEKFAEETMEKLRAFEEEIGAQFIPCVHHHAKGSFTYIQPVKKKEEKKPE